jgi:hypothetical protein
MSHIEALTSTLEEFVEGSIGCLAPKMALV